MSEKIDEMTTLYEQYCRAENTKDKIYRGLKLAEKYHQFVEVFRQIAQLKAEIEIRKKRNVDLEDEIAGWGELHENRVKQLKAERDKLKTKLKAIWEVERFGIGDIRYREIVYWDDIQKILEEQGE